MAPSYKVIHFNFNGRGEPIRMLLTWGGIPFEDNRIEWADWPKIKPSMKKKIEYSTFILS